MLQNNDDDDNNNNSVPLVICFIKKSFQEEERRLALVMARKEEERRRELNKVAVLKVRHYDYNDDIMITTNDNMIAYKLLFQYKPYFSRNAPDIKSHSLFPGYKHFIGVACVWMWSSSELIFSSTSSLCDMNSVQDFLYEEVG